MLVAEPGHRLQNSHNINQLTNFYTLYNIHSCDCARKD